jgi:uncharacterized membrane protein
MTLEVAVVSFISQHGAVSAFSSSSDDVPWRDEVAFVEETRKGRMVIRGTFAGHYVDVNELDRTSDSGTAEGALTGALVGAIFGFGPPGAAFGFIVGGALGAVEGKPSEVESEPDTLVDRLRAAIPKGGSAVVLLAAPEHVDAMIDALAGSGGEVTRRKLTDEEADAVQAALGPTPKASSRPTPQGQGGTGESPGDPG